MRKPIPRILIARLANFTGGLNLRDDAFTLRPNELADCLNMRVMPTGGMRQRKTMLTLNSTSFTAVKNIWPFYGNGVKQIVVQDGNDALYSTGGATFTAINPDGLTLTGIMRAATFSRLTAATSERLYVQRNAEQVAWKWSGTAAAVLADAHGAYNDNIAAPAGGKMPIAKYICTHAGFLFHANTVQGGTAFPNRVRWSHPGEAEDYRTNDYVDVGVDDGDVITGIASAGAALYIFKARSVWRLAGYDSATWQLTRLYNTIGAVSQEAVCVSPQGVYFFDGTRGAYLLGLDGKLRWLWDRLYCKLTDGTIPPAYTGTVTCAFMDNRLWVGVPWLTSTAPVRHFVYDPIAGSAGAWYVYYYSLANVDLPSGPMLEWRPDSATTKLLMIGNTNTAVQTLEHDESSVDTIATSGFTTSTFSTFFTTAWFTAGAPGIKKQFKRPTFIVGAEKPTTLAIATYKNFQTLTPKNVKQVVVTAPGGGGVNWGAANWGSFNWGAAAKDDQAIVRSANIGNLYAVQMNVSTPPGSFVSLNAIEYHYLIRRF